MAGDVQSNPFNLAKIERLTVHEKMIELRPVPLEIGTGVEQLAENLLHTNYTLADTQLSSQPFLQIGGGGDVIRMRVGLKDPDYLKIVLTDIFEDEIGGTVGGSS